MATPSKNFAPGDVVFKEGETTREAYILMKGSLQVLKNDEVVAEISEEGSFIGEMAVLLGEPRTATVIAKEQAELGVVTDKNFDTLVQKMPTVAYKLAKSLAFRLRETTRELIDLRHQKGDKNGDSVFIDSLQSDLAVQVTQPAADPLESLLSEAQRKYQEKDHMEAIPLWQKALEKTSDKDKLYMIQNNIGCAYLALGDLKKAMLHFGNTVKINPNGEEILLNFALIYYKTNNKQKAAELYQKVIRLNPSNHVAFDNLEELAGG